jgi:hypothetical protein
MHSKHCLRACLVCQILGCSFDSEIWMSIVMSLEYDMIVLENFFHS